MTRQKWGTIDLSGWSDFYVELLAAVCYEALKRQPDDKFKREYIEDMYVAAHQKLAYFPSAEEFLATTLPKGEKS